MLSTARILACLAAGLALGACGSDSDAGNTAVDAPIVVDAVVHALDAPVPVHDALGVATDGGCSFGSVSSAGTDQNLNLFGQTVYFADGVNLPAGHYQVSYLDGCMKYSGNQDWTIQAYADGTDAWYLVGNSTAVKIVEPPGTVGYMVSNGAYATFDACVAANLAQDEPVDFDFAGGPIGVWLQDSGYDDNVAGEDGRNPKWQLVYQGTCSQ